MPKHAMNDVIVLIPGLMGSVLQRDEHDVWAVNAGSVLDFIRTLGHNLTALELRHDDLDADVAPDGIRATRLMPDIHLIPGLWSIDGYGKVRASIFERFAATEGENYLELPYDWRRSNRSSAVRLQKAVEPVHLRGILSGQGIDPSMFESLQPTRIGVDVDELFAPDEPIQIRARADRDDLRLRAQLSNADTGEIARTADLASNRDGSYRVELPPLPEGCYRVLVAGGTSSVTSLISVIG